MFSKEKIEKIRKDFPFLEYKVNGRAYIYFDGGATSQKPRKVIDDLKAYYEFENGNPHRGAHYFSTKATEIYENSRKKVADFIGSGENEIVFTKNATEGFNLIAYSWALNNLGQGDEILISIMEHHSNLVVWQEIAKKTGASLVYLYIDENMKIIKEDFESKLGKKTKLFSITAASNVVATIPDLTYMIKKVREKTEAKIIVDACQFASHNKIDVKKMDCDFLVFSGHKLLSAMGIGVLFVREEILNSMEPFLYGGDMIEYVYEDRATYMKGPQKFEAGTPNVGGALTLASAISYLEELGMDNILAYERELTDYCFDRMKEKEYLQVYTCPSKERSPLISFNMIDVHPHDLASILDSYGIGLRSGHHCAQPLHRFLKCNFSCRASFSFYNTKEEIDEFIKSLDKVRKVMGLES